MKISASIIVRNEEENIAAAFIRTYPLKRGLRDGVPGLIITIFRAYSVFLKFAKVLESNNVKKKD